MDVLRAAGQIWDTSTVPEHEQFGFWREVVWDAFVPVSLVRFEEGPFISSVTGRHIGPLAVSRIVSRPQSVTRTKHQVERHAGDVYFLNMPLSDGSSASQDGRVAELSPGDFALVDSTRPFELSFKRHFEQISLAIPHDLLSPLLAAPEDVTGMRVPATDGVGAVASNALRALLAGEEALDRETSRRLAEQIVALIALSLGGGRRAPCSSGPGLLTQAAMDEAGRSLADPELTPGVVAARIGVSIRYLHELFSRDGLSFGRWVHARRLERCHRDLAELDSSWTIAQIALRNGFNDPSYFARAYRRRYGRSPRERRVHAQQRLSDTTDNISHL